MENVKLSERSINAMKALALLEGKDELYEKDTLNVRRTCEVYVASCELADAIKEDCSNFMEPEPSSPANYEILHKSKMIVRTHHAHSKKPKSGVTHPVGVPVGAGYCATWEVNWEKRACVYVGIKKC